MSVLAEMDVTAIKNTILRGKSNSETKIVKVTHQRKQTKTSEEEVKIVVKAAAHPSAGRG